MGEHHRDPRLTRDPDRLGGKPFGTTALDFLGRGSKSGYVNPGSSTDPDSNQGVIVSVGDDITTSGKGGVGVFAQSVGGSGGIAGDIGWTMQKTTMGRSGSYTGPYRPGRHAGGCRCRRRRH